jgi:hypothetical protein
MIYGRPVALWLAATLSLLSALAALFTWATGTVVPDPVMFGAGAAASALLALVANTQVQHINGDLNAFTTPTK